MTPIFKEGMLAPCNTLANRRKKILVADMDSTMIDQECIDELADAVGIKAEVAAITARAMNGELDFAAALRTRVALLKGLDRRVIEEIRRERITLAAGGRALIQTMKAYGAFCSLVSGGFTYFANYYGERIGFDEAIANTLVFDGDRLAGTVADPIVDKTTKLTRLLTLADERSVPISQTMAVIRTSSWPPRPASSTPWIHGPNSGSTRRLTSALRSIDWTCLSARLASARRINCSS